MSRQTICPRKRQQLQQRRPLTSPSRCICRLNDERLDAHADPAILYSNGRKLHGGTDRGRQQPEGGSVCAAGSHRYSDLSFTTTHSGTAQYLVAGMAPGNYNVSVNGTTVASCSVNANDNTLYFESTAGLVQIESSGTLALAATPSFTPAAGTYSSTQTVTISTTTPSATIYYTTNGSTPTTSSAVYSGPIAVSATETLQAIAVAPGYSNSAVGSAAYTITSAAATTTSLTATPNPVGTGQTLTLTATIHWTGSTTPTGTVNIMSGSTPLGTAPVNSSGVATLTITTLAVGSYSLTAQYSGNANFLSSTSAAVSVTVYSQATTTSLTATPNPVAPGHTLTLTAAVQGTGSTAPAGTVSFMSGSTLLGTATLNASGIATLTTASLAAGTYSLTAQYPGNASFLRQHLNRRFGDGEQSSHNHKPNCVSESSRHRPDSNPDRNRSRNWQYGAWWHDQLPKRIHAAWNGYPQFLRHRHADHLVAGCRDV